MIISLVATDPPGRLVRGAGGELEASDEEKEAHWTLDALTTAVRELGITVGRSQVRRILLVEGVKWRNPHPWGESNDPEFVPKGQESSLLSIKEPENATTICMDELLGLVSPRTYPPAPGWSSDSHRIKAPLQYGRGPEKVWVYGALRMRETVGPLRSLPPRAILKVTCARSGCQKANPTGDLYLITDNLSSHKSPPIREWLEEQL